MDSLINGLMVPILFLARLWVQWTIVTLFMAVVVYGLMMIVNHPSNKAFDWWWKYGVLGPPRLALSLLGPKPKKKKGH